MERLLNCDFKHNYSLMPKLFLLLMFGWSMLSCQKFESFKENDPSYANEGFFIKTSINPSDLNNISIEKPRAIANISDFFVDANFLYVADFGKGIHIFKNPNDPKPLAVGFINIPALRKFVVKDGFIIGDSGNDLISIKIDGLNFNSIISGVSNIATVTRKKELFTFPNYPIEQNVYFECPDSVGFVTEWEKKVVDKKLNCYR